MPRDAARAGDGHAQQGVRARHRLHVPPAQQLLKGLDDLRWLFFFPETYIGLSKFLATVDLFVRVPTVAWSEVQVKDLK